jgi:hypothetical protein
MLDFDGPWALASVPGTTTCQARLRFVKGSVLKILRQNDNSGSQKVFRHLILRCETSTRRRIY